MTTLKNENISFLIDENDENDKNNENNENEEFIISNILNEEDEKEDELDLTHFVINYQINYTVKQLLQICDYYGIAKELRTNKCNKDEIINILVHFENDYNNSEIVFKRQTMWLYINELKNDSHMKKYIFF